MITTPLHKTDAATGRPGEDRGGRRIRSWANLLLGVAGLLFFIFVLAPWMQEWGPVNTLHSFIRERDIDATPLFYTECDEYSIAERHLRDAARFQPHAD